jgi:hypothetical protein
MSAGNFTSSKYEAGSGGIYRIRVQPETLALAIDSVANGPPAGAIDQATSARARGGKRQFGVIARTVTLQFTASPPTGYSGDNVIVPVMTPDTYDFYTETLEKTGTYLGAAVKVVGQSPERRR